MSTVRITLYSRPGCHLCETMAAVARAAAADFGAEFEEMDVDEDAELAARYDLEVPVLCVNGVKAFSIQVSPSALRARLAREGR